MSRDHEWEDDRGPRRRSDRWGEEEPDVPRAALPERSAVVTTLGVITLILGILVTLVGLCGGAGLLIAGTAEMERGGFAQAQAPLLIGLLVCVVTLFWGVGAIASGIGLISRRNWARVLTLLLSSFGAVAGLISLFIAAALLFTQHFGPEAGILILGFLFYLFLGLVFLAYGVWTYVVLLRSRYAAEFR